MFNQRTARRPAALDEQALAPYRVALAGILVLEGKGLLDDARTEVDLGKGIGKLNDAQKEVDAANRSVKNDADDRSPQRRELLHLEALLDFLRCKSLPREDLAPEDFARNAEKAWGKLRQVQNEVGDPAGEARTCLYLSQLHFFRWQLWAVRRARDELKKYAMEFKKDFIEYKQRLNALTELEAKYQADKKEYDGHWKSKTVKERNSCFTDLEKRWKHLKDERIELTKIAGELALRQKEMRATYDAVWGDQLPNPAKLAGDASSSPVAARVIPPESELKDLIAADDLVGQATRILADSPLYPNLQYIALCHRASVLRVRAQWDREHNGEAFGHLKKEALDCLDKAVALLEQPRLSLSEGDVARADFLSQYSQAFDQLIEWYRLDDPTKALVYAELCRNRSLLDWIRSNGDDPQSLNTDQELLHKAEEAFEKSTHLAAELESMDEEAKVAKKSDRSPDPDVRNRTLDEFKDAKQHYEELQRTNPGENSTRAGRIR